MEAILDKLMQSPKLGLYLQQIQARLRDERAARQQFYEEMTEGAKAEFINGQIVLHSPVRLQHELVSGLLYRLLSAYADARQLGHVGHEKLLVCLTRNDYEPDLCFFASEKAAALTADQLRFPAPDMVVEVISESTEGTDRGIKFEDYAAHGVREYWIVDPDAQVIEQYLLRGDAYELARKVSDGTIASPVVTGFEIQVRAVFDKRENQSALLKLLS